MSSKYHILAQLFLIVYTLLTCSPSRVQKKPVWGTCAGLIVLSEQANATKKGGQELIGGLDVRVHRNHFGRQVESFIAPIDLPFLKGDPFQGVFIRAPVVEKVLDADPTNTNGEVTVVATLPDRVNKAKAGISQADVHGSAGDIIAVRQGNVLGTSFHPELTPDARMHVWFMQEFVLPK